jgi:hypothetical protein
MATREPIRRPFRLGWPTELQLAEPTEVIDVCAEGRETFFVVLARLADGRYAIWSQAEWSGIRCTEAQTFSGKEVAKKEFEALVRTVVDCANAQARA